LPQELKEMSQREQIISLENTRPIRCEKIAYYADHNFIDRLKSVSPTLAKLGRKLPSKKQLEDVWCSGELASPVPSLDLDLHEAIVQSRIRDLTTADVEKGIDLRKLALDTSALMVASGSEGIAPEQVEDFVNGFFDALDAVNEYDDEEIGERPSDDELAALDAEPDAGIDAAAQAQAEVDEVAELDNVLDTALAANVAPNAVAVSVSTDNTDDETVLPDGLNDLPNDEELAAMMDAAMPDDDGMSDEAEADMLAALDAMVEPPTMDDELAPETESRAPFLDLGVLDKPLLSTKNSD
jgi:traN protein